MIEGKIPHLDFGMRVTFVTFDDDEVAWCELCKYFMEAWLFVAAQFVDDGPAVPRNHSHLRGAGLAMAETVTAFMVDVEGMMRVLDGRDAITAICQFNDEFFDECRLPGILEARNADYLVHG
jgi:hypothetical protein